MNRLVQEPVEEQAAGARIASIEAEGELVEVVVELLGLHGALVGGEQPAFEQRGDAVDPRQQLRGVLGEARIDTRLWV